MKTKRIFIRKPKECRQATQEAGLILRSGGLVAFPTETVYGLGANALDPNAVRKIFRAKNRPADNPLIIHIGYKKDLRLYTTDVSARTLRLIREFWPGPLTLILHKSDIVPDIVSCGMSTVAVRMPASNIALKLIRSARIPVAAPSANRSGRPSPTSAEHVLEDLDGLIEAVIDAGETRVGIESTVLDMTIDPPAILRPGIITEKQIRRRIGPVRSYHSSDGAQPQKQPKSPGMKYRHYAPDAKLIIVQGLQRHVHRRIADICLLNTRKNLKTGILTTQLNHRYRKAEVIYIGSTPREIGRNLFKALRQFNRLGVDLILSESIPEKGFGSAIMNRLKKAAGYQILKVKP